jgi:GTPase
VLLAINKTDDKRSMKSTLEFFELGFDPVLEISAEHGTGVAELLDEIVDRLGTRYSVLGTRRSEDLEDDHEHRLPSTEQRVPSTEQRVPSTESRETRIAIVGRPNVGKSSLVNRLLREERVLVSDMPGTTRDAIDSPLLWHRRRFRIIDTAGMRRPGRVSGGGKVEMVSVGLAKEAIAEADVVALVIDAKNGASDQDAAIGGEADRAGRGIVIVVNKWDLVKTQDSTFVDVFDEGMRHGMRFLDYAPILHVSALTGERTSKVLETMDKVAAARRTRVSTPALNRFLAKVTAANPPVSPGRTHVRILYAAQIGVAPPSFVFFTNVATTFHFSYQRFLINKLREEFGFVGSPIRLQVRRRTEQGGSGPRAPRRKPAGRRVESRAHRAERKERKGK